MTTGRRREHPASPACSVSPTWLFTSPPRPCAAA